jgi:hypothetical protein
MTARQLPFEVAPTVRYHEIGDAESGQGLLKFRRKDTLSIGERLEVQEVDQSADLFQRQAALCRTIEESSGDAPEALKALTPGQIYNTLRDLCQKVQAGVFPPLSEAETAIALNHTDDVLSLAQAINANQEGVILRQATCMIRNRLRNCADWTDADTRELDSEKLIAEIALFWLQESMGGKASTTADAAQQLQELEEALGKLREASGSPPSPTGEASTGDAEPLTQEHQSSSPTDSEISLSNTSPTRSRKLRTGKPSGSTTKASA